MQKFFLLVFFLQCFSLRKIQILQDSSGREREIQTPCCCQHVLANIKTLVRKSQQNISLHAIYMKAES